MNIDRISCFVGNTHLLMEITKTNKMMYKISNPKTDIVSIIGKSQGLSQFDDTKFADSLDL